MNCFFPVVVVVDAAVVVDGAVVVVVVDLQSACDSYVFVFRNNSM